MPAINRYNIINTFQVIFTISANEIFVITSFIDIPGQENSLDENFIKKTNLGSEWWVAFLIVDERLLIFSIIFKYSLLFLVDVEKSTWLESALWVLVTVVEVNSEIVFESLVSYSWLSRIVQYGRYIHTTIKTMLCFMIHFVTLFAFCNWVDLVALELEKVYFVMLLLISSCLVYHLLYQIQIILYHFNS